MLSLMRAHFDPSDYSRRDLQLNPVAGITVPAEARTDLPGLEMLHFGTEHPARFRQLDRKMPARATRTDKGVVLFM
jgi:hypothetical protein